MPDVPGQLAKVAALIGEAGGNIVEVQHQRLFGGVVAKAADPDVTVETRDRDHMGELVSGAEGRRLHRPGAGGRRGLTAKGPLEIGQGKVVAFEKQTTHRVILRAHMQSNRRSSGWRDGGPCQSGGVPARAFRYGSHRTGRRQPKPEDAKIEVTAARLVPSGLGYHRDFEDSSAPQYFGDSAVTTASANSIFFGSFEQYGRGSAELSTAINRIVPLSL